MDYAKLAQDGCYTRLVKSLEMIGYCAAEFIKNQILGKDIPIERLHPIGFSFGAHAAAVTSENIRSIGMFERLTGRPNWVEWDGMLTLQRSIIFHTLQ